MELFTVGIGNYTEQDVRESARAFTGYRLDLATQRFGLLRIEHDAGPKEFLGRTRQFQWRRHHRHFEQTTGLRGIHWPKNLPVFYRGRTISRSW